MKKTVKVIEMSVKDYVELHNENHEVKITRHDVYAMIKNGELEAYKNDRGAYVVKHEVVEEKVEENSVKDFTAKYNRRFPKEPITEKSIREMAAKGLIKAKKVSNRWVILQSPRKKIRK